MPLQRLCVGDRVPQVCYIRDLAAFFGISRSQAHRRHARGEFTTFALPRLAGAPASFSGAKLIAWRDGQAQTSDALRYFQSARITVARHG